MYIDLTWLCRRVRELAVLEEEQQQEKSSLIEYLSLRADGAKILVGGGGKVRLFGGG